MQDAREVSSSMSESHLNAPFPSTSSLSSLPPLLPLSSVPSVSSPSSLYPSILSPPPSFSLLPFSLLLSSLLLTGILARVFCSLACPRADCAHFVVLVVRASPVGTPTLDELGREPAEDCNGLVPWQRLRTSPRTDDHENITEVNLREWHGLVYAAARRMRPTDASAATPSADSQEARQKPGTRNAGRTRERTRRTAPVPLVERSIFSRGATQETTGLTAAEFCRGCGSKTTPSSSYIADGVEAAGRQRGDLCQDRRGFEPGQGQEQLQRGCQQAKDPKNPHSAASTLRTGRGRGLPCWRRRSRTATSSRYSYRTTSPPSAPAPGHGSPSEGQEGSGGCQAGRSGHRGAFGPQPCGGRSIQGHASAAQQRGRTVGAETSDGDGQCRAVSLRIARSPDGDRASLADPVGCGVSQLPQRRSAGRLRRLLQGARAQPGLRGFSAHRRAPVSPPAPAPETPPAAGAFAPFPSEAQDSKSGPFPRSAPAGCPSGQSSARPCRHIHTGAQRWLVRMICTHSLKTRLATLVLGAWIRLSQGILEAPRWGFRFRRVRRIFSISKVGRKLLHRVHRLFLSHLSRVSWSSARPLLLLFATPSVRATTRLACFATLSPRVRWMRCMRGDKLAMRRPLRTSSSSRTVRAR